MQRSFGCEVLCEAGILLALPLVTVATAQTLLQRFYYVKAIQKYSVREMLPACVLAATKLEETHVDCRSILNVITFLLQRRDKVPTEPINIYDREYGRSKEKMFMCERKLLKSLGFRVYGIFLSLVCFFFVLIDFSLRYMDHPHRYILPFLKILDCHQNRELAQSAWNFLNDSLRTTLCVQYAPYVVAATAIYLAARIIKKALPDGYRLAFFSLSFSLFLSLREPKIIPY